MKNTVSIALGSLCAVTLAACANYPAPVDKLKSANAAVQQADQLGARQDAQGAMHLQLAREEIRRAERLMAADENKEAEFALVRARADADLALAEARSLLVASRAAKAETEIAQLRNQINATGAAIAARSPQPSQPSPQAAQPVGNTTITSGTVSPPANQGSPGGARKP